MPRGGGIENGGSNGGESKLNIFKLNKMQPIINCHVTCNNLFSVHRILSVLCLGPKAHGNFKNRWVR